MTSEGVTTGAELKASIDAFASWLERYGYASYDPYDLMGTRYGLWARGVYYRHGKLGVPLIAPLLLAETLWPGCRSLFVHKQRYATTDGQLILAFLNLHRVTGAAAWLKKAEQLGEEMLGYAVPGYRGHCWGYPFDWQNNRGLWRKDTPYITCTPYGFEAFLTLHEQTGQPRYLEIARSIVEFVFHDLKDTPTAPNAAASSYSPMDGTLIINTSAYRSWVLFEAAHRLGRQDCLEKAQKNLNFILQNQRADGSWLYGIDTPGNAFIDHFHTCFVLKNLFKLNRHLRSDAVRESIRRGYDYYRKELFHADGTPKSFAIEPRTQIVKLDMYNVAEAITLGALLRQEIPEALEVAKRLAHRLATEWQLPAGHYITRLYRGGFRHTLPFLRWPQAQLFYSATNLLSALANSDAHPRNS